MVATLLADLLWVGAGMFGANRVLAWEGAGRTRAIAWTVAGLTLAALLAKEAAIVLPGTLGGVLYGKSAKSRVREGDWAALVQSIAEGVRTLKNNPGRVAEVCDVPARDVVVTEESRWYKFFSSQNANYDPDRIEYDKEQLRKHYRNRGYYDFRVVSSIADRITVLQHGSVIADGPYAEVSKNPQVIEAYMGSADVELEGAH